MENSVGFFFTGDADSKKMAGSIKFDEYNPLDDFSIYTDRLEQHFKALDIKDAKRIPILLSSLGQSVYKTLRDLSYPKAPSELEYNQIIDLLKRQYSTKVNLWHERRKFHELKQTVGESIIDFLARIKKSAVNCEFSTSLEEVLKQKFVTGLCSSSIFERLAEEKASTPLEKLVELAQTKEMTSAAKSNDLDVFVTSRFQQAHSNNSKWRNDKFNQQNNENKNKHFKSDFKQFSNNSGAYKNSNNNFKSFSNNFKNYNKHLLCKNCNKKGHVAKNCFKNKKYVNTVYFAGNQDDLELKRMWSIGCNEEYTDFSNDDFKVKITIENKEFLAFFDSGSCISAMAKSMYVSNFKFLKLFKDTVKLKVYNGNVFAPLGYVIARTNFQNKTFDVKFYVVENGESLILGRDWLHNCGAKVVMCNFVEGNNKSQTSLSNKLIREFSEIFSGTLGKYNRNKVKLNLKPDVEPVFMRARPIPFALKESVEKELDRLEQDGIIMKVENSAWASPIVAVPKKNGSIRLCGDFKKHVNDSILDDRHPVPKIEEMFIQLNGSKIFSKIDMAKAYNQLELEDESKEILTWNTTKGLYKPNRLMFGVKIASGKFQREMEYLFKDIPEILIFQDDFIIHTKSKDLNIHYTALRKVCERLRQVGMTVNKDKCRFFQTEIEFLGHKINERGIQKTQDKIEAVLKAKRPENVSEVRSLVGLIQFYSKFLPKLADVLSPLYQLLRKGVRFCWNSNCEAAFSKVKQMITSDEILVHYDPGLPIILATDASETGISGILLHKINGKEMPVAYWSRSLSQTEKNYAVLHREALAIVESVKKYYQYLYGRHFIIKTDHRALTTIFGPKKEIPKMAAGRLQRYAIFLSQFSYEIMHVKGSANVVPDYFSRAAMETENLKENDISLLSFMQKEGCGIPVNLEQVKLETENDDELIRVKKCILKNKWEKNDCEKYRSYFEKKDELFVDNNVLMWGHRIIVPKKLRHKILQELHSAHLGIVKTKKIIRGLVYWPQVDKDVEKLISGCEACLRTRPAPPNATATWPSAEKVWSRVHADHLGPVNGNMYLLITDSFSKWLEVMKVRNLTAKETVEKFREVFARFGLPNTVVTDNATSFKSEETELFFKLNGIEHLTSPPYSPQCNGMAERAVKTFKEMLKTAQNDARNRGEHIETLINRLLINYRSTPHCSTEKSPAEMMFGRNIRTRLSQIAENPRSQVREMKNEDKIRRKFEKGEQVMIRDFRRNFPTWTEGIVVKKIGRTVYKVKCKDGELWKRHVNQLHKMEQRKSRKNFRYSNNNAGNHQLGRSVIVHNSEENGRREASTEAELLEYEEMTRDQVSLPSQNRAEEGEVSSRSGEEISEENVGEKSDNSEDSNTTCSGSREGSYECVRVDYENKDENSKLPDKQVEGSFQLGKGKRVKKLPENLRDFIINVDYILRIVG